jgi:outer membrane protein OmpA-like peptidoglycan-associated protein
LWIRRLSHFVNGLPARRLRRALFPLALLLILLLPPGAGAEEFRFIHRAGENYRILSVVNEDVYLNRRLIHRAEILNRISVQVTAERNGVGRHEVLFQTSERAVRDGGNSGFRWEREYRSVFDRDGRGRLTIDAAYFMPVVRDAPVFPAGDLKPGDTWTAGGSEVHDFRDSFGVPDPYRIDFTARYEYLGERTWKGREFPAFSVSYRINDSPPAVRGRLWPRRITGASDQIHYWDRELGRSRSYEESFRMIFELSDGTTAEYRGTARAEALPSPRMDKEQMAGDIGRDLEGLGAGVRVDQEGVTISLEAIQFAPDSPELLPAEEAKLDAIAEILARYPDRDILVAGHTALAGTAEGRQELSLRRASAAADYLIRRGVRSRDRVMVRSYGADRPLADNNTEEGRRRNRRVEITILEN